MLKYSAVFAIRAAVLSVGLFASLAPAQQARPAPAPIKPLARSVGVDFVAQAADIAAISQIVLHERRARDRGLWEEMLSTYWPDSRVDLAWYHGDGAGFVAGSKAMFDRGARPVHRMFAPAVVVRGDKAHAEVHALTWSTNVVRGVNANFETSMRLNYRLVKRGGEWRIISLNPIYEFAKVSADAPGEAINIPAAELAKYRKSYALLSWNQAQNGNTLAQDELGTDRPEQLKTFYDSIRAWLDE